MRKPRTIQECLTQQEINECLQKAFAELSVKDRENIKQAIAPLLKIPRMGIASALRLIFAIDQAPEVKRLNELLVTLEGG